MNHKQGKAHKLLDFFAGKGFYVVLILCVAAIGASGYMLFFGGSGETPQTPDSPLLAAASPQPSPSPPRVSPSPAVPSPPPVSASSPPALPSPPDIGTNAGDGSNATDVGNLDGDGLAVAGELPGMPAVPPDNPSPTPDPKPASDAVPSFYPPVNGDMIVGYSESADVFYEALREWRYHPGVDIETNAGALVQAAADGIIIDVIENAPRSMGATVIIEHSGGFVSVYSNLSSTITATVGKSVKAGDTIASIGHSSISEQALPPHLHFEILKDGEPVDPMDYLP
ncbi:MAG: peptidoglycan DD-metalloendopeptidase family protein [Oscillospiraceae bacterium]|nr:peptidoglycan DD-metalloendopeptidase family protein [Oscillospiraceae bacterium]